MGKCSTSPTNRKGMILWEDFYGLIGLLKRFILCGIHKVSVKDLDGEKSFRVKIREYF